jgi:drug/metabolite transporter (DMT)-like permease
LLLSPGFIYGFGAAIAFALADPIAAILSRRMGALATTLLVAIAGLPLVALGAVLYNQPLTASFNFNSDRVSPGYRCLHLLRGPLLHFRRWAALRGRSDYGIQFNRDRLISCAGVAGRQGGRDKPHRLVPGGLVVLHERLRPTQRIGMAFVFCGMTIVAFA